MVSVVPSKVKAALEVRVEASLQYATRLAAPEPPTLPMQVELIEKQPPERSIPLAKVLVALVPVTLR